VADAPPEATDEVEPSLLGRLGQLVASPVVARGRRMVALVVLCGYALTLGLASLELVPFPERLSGVSAASSDAASLLREAAVIPGPALFYDRDETPIGVLTNCVQIIGFTGSEEEAVYRTPMCASDPDPALLGGPVDKALVRLLFDGLVYRSVAAGGAPTSGDRILAAIGHQFCDEAPGEPDGLWIVWSQAVEDRRDGTRAWVFRSQAHWSCTDNELIDREWYPSFVYPELPS
jgi:hypothetical protein